MTVDDVRMLCEREGKPSLSDEDAIRLVEALVAREEHEAVTILDDQSGWADGEYVNIIVSDVECADGTQRVAMCWGAEGPKLFAVDDDVRTCADLVTLVSDEDHDAQEEAGEAL